MSETIEKANAKTTAKKKTSSRQEHTGWPGWLRLIPERCTNDLATRESFFNSFVSVFIPAQTTVRESIRIITAGANIPFPTESLGEGLDTGKQSRGRAHFKYLGDVLDEIAETIPNMRWWLTDKGLNMEVIPPENLLAPFDAIVIKSCAKFWKTTRLSRSDLQLIARELDEQNATSDVSFLDRFPPKAREALKKHNHSYPKQAIKTFERAAAHSQYTRDVRRILYRARERCVKVQRASL